MNDLKVFSNTEFGELGVMIIDGKEYFPATQCAKLLGYANAKDAVIRHCKGVVKHDLPTNGGKQEVNYIPEGDLYRLIVSSKLPSAEKFERWVFDEVLPSMQSQWETLKAWFASAASSLTLPQIDTAAFSGASLSGYASAWGTAQPQYNGNKNGFAGSYNGLTKQDVIDAVKAAYPDGDVIINVGEQEFGRICRDVISKAGRQTGKPVIKN